MNGTTIKASKEKEVTVLSGLPMLLINFILLIGVSGC